MKQSPFRGTGVALVTPFLNGAVDYIGLEKLISYVIDGGVDYLVSLGTTGESATLSEEESRAIIDFTIKVNNDRLPVVVGMFGHNNTAQLIQKIKNFNFDGIAAVLSSSPSYSKPTQEGIYQHYMAIEKVIPVPIIIYNVPGRTSSNVLPETIVRLANASKKFIAVKEASGDLVQTAKIVKDCPDHFLVLSGDDPTALGAIAYGADGVISVIANALPNHFSNMIAAALDGNFKNARAINAELFDIHHWLYVEGNPAGIKAALEMQKICSKEVRLPLVPLTAVNCLNLKSAIGSLLT